MLAPSDNAMKKIYSPSAMKKTAKKPEDKKKSIEPSKFMAKK